MNLFPVNMSNILSSFKANNVGEIWTAFIPLIGLIAIVPQACLLLTQHGENKAAFVNYFIGILWIWNDKTKFDTISYHERNGRLQRIWQFSVTLK